MLWFEREVVRTLMSPTLDAATRAAVERYVDGTLASMPEHLRAGVAAESVALGAPSWIAARLGRLDEAKVQARLDAWRDSPIDVVRQYVRLLHSLVLFAENELAPAPTS
ncbi:MAG TPA: hypothetical protein VFR41_10415 [Acidimicrobiia bacterium]|nr:hypothetical protein [Acidimicrobiia bacterium]